MTTLGTRPLRPLLATALVTVLAAGCSGNDTPGAASSPTGSATTSGTAAAPSTSGTTSGTASGTASGTTGTTSAPATTGTSTGTGTSGSGQFPVALSSLSGEATELSVNQAFVDALRTVKVNLEPVAPATSTDSGGTTTFRFPVSGGQATVEPGAADPFTGSVEHDGGLRLSFLNRSVTIEDLVIDADDDGVRATINGQEAPLLSLDDSTAKFRGSGDTATVTYTAVTLLPDAADRLSGELGIPLPQVQLGQLQSTLSGS